MNGTFEGYVIRLETQSLPARPTRHVAFLIPDPADPDNEFQVETHNPQLQATIETAYSLKRKVAVTYIEDGGQRYLTIVNILQA